MRAPGWRGQHRGLGAAPSPFFDPQAAGRGPFLDTGEVVVGAVAVRPHRQIERGIGLVLVLEGADQLFELSSRFTGGNIGRLRLVVLFDLELQRLLLSRGIVAAESDISDLADRATRRNIAKT